MEIIQRLGLDYKLPYASINAKEIDPMYDISWPVLDFRDSLYPDTDLVTNHFAKDTKFSLSKSGNTATLIISRIAYKSPLGPIEARLITIKIVNGLIVSTVTKYRNKDVETEILKSFSGTISAPSGPFLEWNKVYNDPQYNIGNTKVIASYNLKAFVREVLSYAAFNGNTSPTLEDWALVIARSAASLAGVLYDKGIGFTVDDVKG